MFETIKYTYKYNEEHTVGDRARNNSNMIE